MNTARRIRGIIPVQEIEDIVEVGTTVPVRCKLENGINAIVKYMKNPYGEQVLINEFIGSCIADRIDLSIPEYGICEFSPEVILQTNQNEEIDLYNAGPAFYTKEYSKTIPPNSPVLLGLADNVNVEKLILFDYLINNCDRHMGNLLLSLSDKTLYVIDHSHIITENCCRASVSQFECELNMENLLSDRFLRVNGDVYKNISAVAPIKKSVVIEDIVSIQKKITPEFLVEIREELPDAWTKSIGEEKLGIIFEIIHKRCCMLNEIVDMIIKEVSI